MTHLRSCPCQSCDEAAWAAQIALIDAIQNAPPPAIALALRGNVVPVDAVTRRHWAPSTKLKQAQA